MTRSSLFGLRLFLGAIAGLSSHLADAQQSCPNPSFGAQYPQGNPQAGDYWLYTGDCGGELYSHFLGAKGTFLNAVSFTSHSLNKICNLDGTVNSCVGYSGECNPNVNPASGCGQDPNIQPGETSCWCRPPEQDWLSTAVGGKIETFQMELRVDDGPPYRQSDKTYFSTASKNPNGHSRVRGQQLFWDSHRFDWEDLYEYPNGDYNDYSHMVEIRECNGGFPRHTAQWEGPMGCANGTVGCSDEGCKPEHTNSNEFRFAMGVQIDDPFLEGNLESPGPKISVTLNTYYNGQNAKRIAVCPVLLLSSLVSGVESGSYAVYSGSVNPKDACDVTSGGNGIPNCVPNNPQMIPGFTAIPVALAREQFVSTSCNQRTGPGDAFDTPTDTKCAAATYSQSYEISMRDIDAAMDQSGNHLLSPGTTYADLEKRLTGGVVYVFQDIVPNAFHCPSGVKVWPPVASPDVAIGATYMLNSSAFSVIKRNGF